MALVFAWFSDNLLTDTTLSLSTLFLPGLLLSLLAVCRYRKCMRDILAHPSLLLLPVFSHFTFSLNTSFCCWKREETQARLALSRNWTFANIGTSIVGLAILIGIYSTVRSKEFRFYTDLMYSLP